MNTTFVVLKAADKDNQTEFDLTTHLIEDQTIESVAAVVAGSPTTPALEVEVDYVDATVSMVTTGGQTNHTYNVRLTVELDNPIETQLYTVAVSVQDSQYVSFQTKNPMSFQRLVDSIEVGESAIGSGAFMLKAGTSFTNAVVRWSLLDTEGVTYSTGNAYDYRITLNSLASRLEAFSVINVPSNTPPSLADQSYMVRWELSGLTPEPIYSFEGIRVLGPTSTPQGTGETIELKGDPANVSIVLPSMYENVALEIYSKNLRVYGPVRAPVLEQTAGGHYYSLTVSTAAMAPNLEAYNVVWSYRNAQTAGQIAVQREIGRLFVVTPTILSAVDDVRAMIMKARTTLLEFPDTLFSDYTILSLLRRGRDFFNGAGGWLTTFDMSAASGPVREYWLGYTEVALLQSQYLAEAEKAFDFQGQAISLSRDVSQAYQQMANDIYSRINEQVRQFKQNLARLGITGGDGNLDGAGRGTKPTAKVGISSYPISRYVGGRRSRGLLR